MTLASVTRQLTRFAVIGLAGTVAYLAVFAGLRLHWSPEVSSLVARVLLAVPTTWLNGQLTFRTTVKRRRLVAGAAFVLGIGSAVGWIALWALEALRPRASEGAELLVVAVASVLAGAARFAVMRFVVFGGPTRDLPAATRVQVSAARQQRVPAARCPGSRTEGTAQPQVVQTLL